MLYYHGGGWLGGDKTETVGELPKFLDGGCAVVSANYRLIKDAEAQHVSPPIAVVFADNRRALQYLRLHAADWNLDPARIIVAGGSAGACSALYLGCAGDLADPNSADPVERVSTKVAGVIANAAQTTLDPKVMGEWVPGVSWGGQAFGYDMREKGFPAFLADREKLAPLIAKYSPDALITKDAPPIYFSFSQALPKPDAKPGELIHCPLWGLGFQKLAQQKGVECYVHYPGHPSEKYADSADFTLHVTGLAPSVSH